MSKETKFKPHLACDVDFSKLRFPMIAMPKIDGVRGLNLDGKLVGRSLKSFKNPVLTEKFSQDFLAGFDGELALGNITDPRLCSNTTGVVSRQYDKLKEGKFVSDANEVVWWIFDYVPESLQNAPYASRLSTLAEVFPDVLERCKAPQIACKLALVPWKMVHTVDEYLAFDAECLEQGFEGSILRDPNGVHKSGRATTKTGAYLRYKQFVDFEGTVVGLEEALENTNEAKTNELGRSERSTHQDNMVPKGMVGTILLKLLKSVEFQSQEVLKAGDIVRVGPGKMTHEDRKFYWENQTEIIGQTGKAKFFPKGLKDKLRFCTWLGFRADEDMS